MVQERRRSVRTPVSWPARLWSDEGVMHAMADDVSDHGIRIVTARRARVAVGRAYQLDLVSTAGAERSLVVEVRHLDEHGRIGFATPARWEPPLEDALAG